MILDTLSQERLKILWPQETSSIAHIIKNKHKNISVNFLFREKYFLFFISNVLKIYMADSTINIREEYSKKLSSVDRYKITFDPRVEYVLIQ